MTGLINRRNAVCVKGIYARRFVHLGGREGHAQVRAGVADLVPPVQLRGVLDATAAEPGRQAQGHVPATAAACFKAQRGVI